MSLLPDLTAAGEIALAVFLLTLGVLVVFVESVSRRAFASLTLIALVLAALLALVGEVGIGIITLAFVAALAGNSAFEWLTTH